MTYSNLSEAVEKLKILKLLSEEILKELSNEENKEKRQDIIQCYEDEFGRLYQDIFGSMPKENMIGQVRTVKFFN